MTRRPHDMADLTIFIVMGLVSLGMGAVAYICFRALVRFFDGPNP